MPKFFWKTEGTRTAGSVTHVPMTVWLGMIIAVAMAIATVMTGNVSEQEVKYENTKAKFQK